MVTGHVTVKPVFRRGNVYRHVWAPRKETQEVEEESHNRRHCVGLSVLRGCVVLAITDFVGVL